MQFKEKLFVEPVDNSVQFEIFKQKVQYFITRHVFHGFCTYYLNNRELIKILLQVNAPPVNPSPEERKIWIVLYDFCFFIFMLML